VNPNMRRANFPCRPILQMFGWYGFNPGSALMISSASGAAAAARAAVTTTLAGAAGSLLLMTVVWFHTR